MPTVRAANPGKTVLHDPAVEVFADGGGNDLSEITILLKMFVGDSIRERKNASKMLALH